MPVEKPKDVEIVILFGCCGALYRRCSVNQFYISNRKDGIIASASGLVHDKDKANAVRYMRPRALIVDRETQSVAEWCQKTNISFLSVKYIIDYCEFKVMPKGINHFWRIFQHWRMQRKFQKVLESFYYE